MSALDDIQTQALKLPPIEDAVSFALVPIPEPIQVVHGVLHRGNKAVFGGPSKAYKTWTLLDLAMAVATGTSWLGFPTTQCPVLYINFELRPFAIQRRLLAIAKARGHGIPPALRLWNLWGHSHPLSVLLPELLRQIGCAEYGLIIPDPIYKTLQGLDENSAGDIGMVCQEIEAVAVQTGAAIAFGGHFAKGNASGKASIDRVAGSGVWSRDADTIITATPHEQDQAFTVDMTLRNFPQQDPFVIRWEFPHMVRAQELDPTRLRQPQRGRAPTHSVADIMKMHSDTLPTAMWQHRCMDAGISATTFYRLIRVAEAGKQIAKVGGLWKRCQNSH